jgi:hypothetical protein
MSDIRTRATQCHTDASLLAAAYALVAAHNAWKWTSERFADGERLIACQADLDAALKSLREVAARQASATPSAASPAAPGAPP